jgi:hypothetical protein
MFQKYGSKATGWLGIKFLVVHSPIQRWLRRLYYPKAGLGGWQNK